MSTVLSIHVSSTTHSPKLDLEFMYNEEWTPAAEEMLLQRLQEIFSLVRKESISLNVGLDLVVKNPQEVFFQLKKKLNQIHEPTIHHHKLSLREIEILGLIMLGHTNQEIADKLFISFETVRSHRKKILEKTGAKNTAALINYYHQTFFEK